MVKLPRVRYEFESHFQLQHLMVNTDMIKKLVNKFKERWLHYKYMKVTPGGTVYFDLSWYGRDGKLQEQMHKAAIHRAKIRKQLRKSNFGP